jgi:hypothetical protein
MTIKLLLLLKVQKLIESESGVCVRVKQYVYNMLQPQVLVDRILYGASSCPSPPFFNIDFFHVHKILQLSMYHCMTYIQ